MGRALPDTGEAMNEGSVQQGELLAFLPEERVGVVHGIEAISQGLSGAGVYAVTTSRGAYVLRVQDRRVEGEYFAHQLRVLRRVAEAEIAPALVHVDEPARAVVSVRIPGTPLPAALANPAERPRVLGSVVEQLRRLHALDTTGLTRREPLPYARLAWDNQRVRPGFPAWAGDLGASFDAIARVLEADPRSALTHNDINPGNVLWDGERVWLVDWEQSGVGHPYFDLASLALFLRLEDDTLFGLTQSHDGAPLTEVARASLKALRKLSGLFCGLIILDLVKDLTHVAPRLADAPSLGDCYDGMRTGKLPLRSPAGQLAFGQALLALGIAAPLSD
jgi:aminoglycoside phosphotransferase (APT) family kinase protein